MKTNIIPSVWCDISNICMHDLRSTVSARRATSPTWWFMPWIPPNVQYRFQIRELAGKLSLLMTQTVSKRHVWTHAQTNISESVIIALRECWVDKCVTTNLSAYGGVTSVMSLSMQTQSQAIDSALLFLGVTQLYTSAYLPLSSVTHFECFWTTITFLSICQTDEISLVTQQLRQPK